MFFSFILIAQNAVFASELSQPTVEELLNRTDDLMRGASSKGTMRMRVTTDRWEREMVMRVMSKGEDKTLVQILSPPREKGTATLKVDRNIWNYLPKVDRTIKIPASMMSGSWMGSHLTNDDLVKDSRFVNDYDCEFTQTPDNGGSTHWVISCIPKPEAAVVWGEVVVSIRGEDLIVDFTEFYDEHNNLIRSIVHSQIEDVGDRRIPRRVQVIPADKPDEITEMFYEEIEFDIDIPDRTFTLQSLRR
jgi:outer membrane lipoprotein-sorting protein